MKPYGDYGIPDSTDPNKENIVLSGQTKVDVAYGTLGLNFPLLARYDEAANHVTYYTRQLPRGGSTLLIEWVILLVIVKALLVLLNLE